MPQNELTFRRYAAEAQKLLKVNAVEGHNVLSVLYSLAGEAEKAIEHSDLALRITNEPILWCNTAAILSNLGFFSEAQKAFVKGASPEMGLFGDQLRLGVCIGSFHTILKFEVIARRMQLDLDGAKLGLVRRIVSLMDEYSITDADRACLRMSISPSNLLQLSRIILDSANSEVEFRNAIGRAYYAAYHAARVFLDSLPSPGELPSTRTGIHLELAYQLSRPTIAPADPLFFQNPSLSQHLSQQLPSLEC